MADSERMKYKVLLHDISQNLSEDNLATLKYFCKEEIGKRRLETLRNGIELFQALEEHNLLSPEDTTFLANLLNSIKRSDLVEKLSDFNCRDVQLGPPIPEVGVNTSNLNLAIDVVCDNVGKDWWMLARKLGLGESQIQVIEYNNPHNMRRQIFTALSEWKRINASKATVDELVTALRSCKLNMVADTVQQKIKQGIN